jgi:hypothetical protein
MSKGQPSIPLTEKPIPLDPFSLSAGRFAP